MFDCASGELKMNWYGGDVVVAEMRRAVIVVTAREVEVICGVNCD